MTRIVLVLLSTLLLILGLGSLTQATQGVGLIAAACALGLYARMAQASHHRDQLLKAIAVAPPPGGIKDPVPPPASGDSSAFRVARHDQNKNAAGSPPRVW
jgi:hypothetical protein